MSEADLPEGAESLSNAPELSVSELSGALKRTIEDRFGYVRVRGEVSNYRGPHSSGHAYFSLKDANARIDAVIWKGVFARLRTKPQEGLEVVVTGKITTFPGKSSYQIVIDRLEPAGVGALMALLEERRRKLAAEGLFDEARKQLLPFLPQTIGVVTSPTGAVIRDILHRLEDRFPRRVLVWPVRVQGESAADEVAAAIRGFNALPEGGPITRPDVLIVARGGGSLEDLWSFNEEQVVRAAADSLIPLISAIGHETDWTLIDYAADLRAPTPTGAAEKAVPVRSELMSAIADLGRRHEAAATRGSERRRADLRGLVRALPNGEALLAIPRQKFDRASERLGAALRDYLHRYQQGLGRAAALLARHAPQAELARARARCEALALRLSRARTASVDDRAERLKVLSDRLRPAFAGQVRLARQSGVHLTALGERLASAFALELRRRREKLVFLEQMRQALGYGAVLARGFVLARGEDGAPLRRARDVAEGARLSLQFADGFVHAVAGATPSPAAEGKKPRPPRGTEKPGRGGQGDLF